MTEGVIIFSAGMNILKKYQILSMHQSFLVGDFCDAVLAVLALFILRFTCKFWSI